MERLKSELKDSFLIKSISKALSKNYNDNLLIKFLDLIYNKSASLFNSLIDKSQKLRDAIDESAIFRLFKFLTTKTYMINGIIIILCMNIPHTRWNNIYILLGMLIITLIYYIRNVLWKEDVFDFKNLGISFILFVLSTMIALFISTDFSGSIRQFILYVTGFLAYMNVCCTIKTRKDLIYFCYLLFIMTTFMSMFGVYQKWVGVEVKEAYVDKELNEGIGGRVYGAVENPNNFAEILLLMIPLCGAIFLGETKWRNKIIVACLTLLPIASMIFTGTRSGWGALGIAAFVFCLLWDKRLIPAFIIAVCLAFVALPYVSPGVYKRVKTIFVSNNDHSMKYRDEIMAATKPVLRDNWISGIGMGSNNFSNNIANNFDFKASAPPHSHNVFVQVWCELGLLGIVSFLLMIISIWLRSLKEIFAIKRLKKINKELYDDYNYIKYILIGTTTGLLGLCVMGFLDYVLFYPRVMILFFIYLGVCRCAIKIAKSRGEENE